MLKLEVIHYKGAVPPRPITAQFDASGGTVGRGDANTMVLPDAERFISRTHARIKFQTDRYVIEDHGSSTPVMLNGRALGRGTEAALAHGDELTIGEYHLRAIVQLSGASSAQAVAGGAAGQTSKLGDPMTMFGAASSADPFGDLAPKAAPMTPSSAARPAVATPADPLADLMSNASSLSDPAVTPANRGSGGIPDDFDPFGGLGRAPNAAAAPPPSSGAAGAALGVAPSPSLDALFGLNPASARDPLGVSGPLASPVEPGLRSGAPSLDPMAAFQDKPVATNTPVQRDDAAVWSGAYVPPKAIPDPDMIKPAESAAAHEAPRTTPGAVPAQAATDTEMDDALLATQRVAVVRHGSDALVNAFLQGAGIANLNLPSGLTPQTMHMLGAVLRETVQAMLDLLLARAMLKRELRAEVTMIIAAENNPLKFSPNVEAALAHLLAPQRGYMQPLDAVKDACNDLRSNQFAFMAGLRAALAGILKRFNPAQLEQRLKQKSVLESLLPGGRKAKMWDLFSDLYAEVSKEAEDDFHELFGREFLRAYEAQVAKLSQRDGGGSRT